MMKRKDTRKQQQSKHSAFSEQKKLTRKQRLLKQKPTDNEPKLADDSLPQSTNYLLFNGNLIKVFLAFKLIIVAAILSSFYYFSKYYHPTLSHKINLWNRHYIKDIFDDWYIPFSNWDGQHYLFLADFGYEQAISLGTNSQAFFPLFPQCIKLVNFVIGDIYSATLLLNLIFSYFFIHFFYGYARHYLPKTQSIKAVVLLLAFPSAFYMTVFYNEALFLFALFGFLYFYQVKKNYISVIFAIMIPLIRGQAVFVLAALGIYILWKFYKQRNTFKLKYELSNILGFVAGGITYGLFFYLTTGSFFTGIDAQKFFVFENSLINIINPGHFLSYLFSPTKGIFSLTNGVIDKYFVIILFLCTVFVIKAKNRLGTLIYFFLLYFTAAMGSGGSFVRFSLLAFPFLSIAVLKLYPKLKLGFYVFCGVMFCLQLWFTFRFSLNMWVG